MFVYYPAIGELQSLNAIILNYEINLQNQVWVDGLQVLQITRVSN